ncbi:hypothetical protein J1614_005167 [Plenodomus biglobosus]|nr:hypothetical protein J1614_005167 [Plenodomus biglobosus]
MLWLQRKVQGVKQHYLSPPWPTAKLTKIMWGLPCPVVLTSQAPPLMYWTTTVLRISPWRRHVHHMAQNFSSFDAMHHARTMDTLSFSFEMVPRRPYVSQLISSGRTSLEIERHITHEEPQATLPGSKFLFGPGGGHERVE